jgi:hypothetical protein
VGVDVEHARKVYQDCSNFEEAINLTWPEKQRWLHYAESGQYNAFDLSNTNDKNDAGHISKYNTAVCINL